MKESVLIAVLMCGGVALTALGAIEMPESVAEWELDDFVVEKRKAANMKLSGPEKCVSYQSD